MIESFALTSENIDLASEKIDAFLGREKVEQKEIIRTKWMLEEILLKYRDASGESTEFSLKLAKKFGRLRIEIFVGGKRVDPFEENESYGILRNVLSGVGMAPTWQYKNGQNIVSFNPRKKKMPPMIKLLISVLLAIIAGGIFSFLPDEWGNEVSATIVTPIFDTIIGFLTALASFVIFFSLIWGIVSIGDISLFEKIGKRMMLRIVIISLAMLSIYMLAILPFFSVSFEGESSFGFGDLFGIFLDIVPDNLVSPFIESNLLQIVFLSVIVGITLLALGSKVGVFSSVVEQGSSVINTIMEGLSSFMPVLVFTSLFEMMLNGEILNVLKSYKLFLLAVCGAVLVMLVYFLLCLRLRVNPLVLLKKLTPATLVALVTASSSAALPVSMDQSIKKMGVDEGMTRFSLPIYQVVFKTATSIEFFIIVLFMCDMHNIMISPGTLAVMLVSIWLLAIATPPTPGSGASILVILFAQFGIPAEAIAIAMSIDILLDYVITAAETFCHQCELLLLSSSMNMVDKNVLKKNI